MNVNEIKNTCHVIDTGVSLLSLAPTNSCDSNSTISLTNRNADTQLVASQSEDHTAVTEAARLSAARKQRRVLWTAQPTLTSTIHIVSEALISDTDSVPADGQVEVEWVELGSVLLIHCHYRLAELHIKKFCSGSKGQCIKYNQIWFTPQEFEAVGPAFSNNWQYSIRCGRHSLQTLINTRILTPHEETSTGGNCNSLTPEEAFMSSVCYLYVSNKRGAMSFYTQPAKRQRLNGPDEAAPSYRTVSVIRRAEPQQGDLTPKDEPMEEGAAAHIGSTSQQAQPLHEPTSTVSSAGQSLVPTVILPIPLPAPPIRPGASNAGIDYDMGEVQEKKTCPNCAFCPNNNACSEACMLNTGASRQRQGGFLGEETDVRVPTETQAASNPFAPPLYKNYMDKTIHHAPQVIPDYMALLQQPSGSQPSQEVLMMNESE